MDVDSQEPWLIDLTETQRQAVTHCGGPLLVLAGPGSGKTRVITRRIACRIAAGVPAWKILALTFTNKAAREMKARVDALVPADALGRRGLVVSTFHSFSAGILRRYGPESLAAAIGQKPLVAEFSIFDMDDAHAVIKSAIGRANLETAQWQVGSVATEISSAKNRLLSAAEYAQNALDFRQRTIARIYAIYEQELVRQNALDFDDLLMRTARMLRDDPVVLAQLQQRFAEVLVDEYQDTNHAQFTVAHSIAREHRNICVVGDPDQSIYAWRGADISNILEFEEHYPGATVVPLGENFRSTSHIVAVADQLIRRNSARRHKDLFTGLGEGVPPKIAMLSDETSEANFVVEEFQRANREGIQWKEMAVLYRMNSLSRTIEDALRRRNIPYVIARGTAFYERREVRDTLSYLRALVNPLDEQALRRIINVPARGIGATSISKCAAVAVARGCSLLEAMMMARQAGIAERTAKSIDGLVMVLARYRSELEIKPAENLGPFVARLITEAGLERAAAAIADDDQDAADRKSNVQEVANAASLYVLPESQPDARAPTLGDALRGFLESVALVADSDVVDPERGVVTLMSLHASKGLEFHTVAIVGIEEGLLPHARSMDSPQAVEEERRLLFVGITRSERSLLLTCAATRAMRGLRMRTIESGFLREISGNNIQRLDLTERVEFEDDESGQDENRRYAGRQGVGGSRRGGDGGFPAGTIVRHAQFGIGTVEEVLPRGSLTSVRVRFRSAGVRTLVLEYAKLEVIA